MAKIKFSHAYKKLQGGDSKPIKRAKLLMVLPITNEQLVQHPDFLKYDTDDGKYEIGFHTWCVLLIFQKPNGDLFTTVRPMHGRYGNKAEYYSKLIGHDFEIVLPSEEPRGKDPDMMAPDQRETAERMHYYQHYLK